MTSKNLNPDLFEKNLDVYRKFPPKIEPIEGSNPKSNTWDIPYTIRELSYLVHSHYRYYGKFPSNIAGQILDQLPPPGNDYYVLDNFCGSGTTLVEAKLRGINSIGIDISWLSCLASNVKTRSVDINKILSEMNRIARDFNKISLDTITPIDSFVQKWFTEEASKDLSTLQKIIKKLPKSNEKDFFLLAFIGIIRRVSKAFDGEVRPHINKEKKQRNVLEAFSKKIRDMCSDHQEYMNLIDQNTQSESILGNNTILPKLLDDGKCYLVISHPPYLNSFNYASVYNLEFYWGKLFEPDYTDGYTNLHKQELTAHPANEKIIDDYFNHLKECYTETYRIQKTGSFLAIVIGDCTRNGELVNVLERTIDIVKKIGYTPYEFNYRTTHYGLGKYAYRHRADYHGDAEKKDGILIFKK